jgi:hypothetical protein
MNMHKLPITRVLAAAVLCQLAASAHADEPGGTCDPTDSACGYGECFTASYSIFDPPAPSTVACTEKSYQGSPDITLRFPWVATPESARIVCHSLGDCSLSCEAWPTGPEISYAWSKTPGAQFNPMPMGYESYAMVDLLTPGSVQIRVRVSGPASSGYTEAAWTVLPHTVCAAN